MAISKIKIGDIEHELQTTIQNVDGLQDALDAKPSTDTKNTAGSTNSSSKLYLIGATSQASNPQTYSHDTAYVGTDGHLYSNSSQVVNLANTQTISGAKTFTSALKILNGSAAGAFVLGANVNSTGLTANTRKLGRMGVPAFTSDGSTVNSTVAGISFDAQQYANFADFGGHPNNASSIAPDVIRFVVANAHNNSVSGSRTLALQISKQNGLTDTAGAPASVLGAKFFVPLIATESITASGGVVGNVTGNLTGTADKSIGDEDGNNIKSTYATKTVASTSANGLLSSTDKSHIDSMWNLWSADGTNDTLVNKVQEVLAAFDKYPEGSTIVDVLASKVNTTTTVNGHALSSDVTVSKSDVGLGNVDNVKQYSASNPPPYPVTSVNSKTGVVSLAKGDVGLGNVDNVKQYSASNPPPYPVTSVAGKTGDVTLAKSDVGLGNVDNKSSATIRSEITSSNVTTALGYTPVSKAGGSMDNNATLKFSTYGTRFITITGNSITADMSNETGGWAGNFAAVKHKDPNSTATDGTTTTTMLGWYGGATALNYIYMGGSYSDPYMKMTPAGQFTFKNTPKVGTTNVALATDIPTNLSDLTADASHRTVTDTEKATWNAKSSFSGSYNDLTNKPTIPTVNNGTLTIQKNGTNVATFTANQSGNATANITVPTKVSELTNDSQYLTSYTETDPTVPSWAKAASKPSYDLGEINDTTSYVKMTAAERTKLSGIAANANNYSLPYRLASYQASGTGSVNDPNNATETGFYYVSSSSTNRPPFSQSSNLDYRLLVTAYGTTWLQQIATDFRCDDIFYRRKENNTWKPWVKIYPIDEATTSAKGLMSSSDKTKLDGIATGANKTTVDTALSSTSTNPVQNKVVNTALGGKLDKNGWSTAKSALTYTGDASDENLAIVLGKRYLQFIDDTYNSNDKYDFPPTKSGTIALTSDLNAKADKSEGIFFIQGTGTTAGTWKGTSDRITSYYDGLTIKYKIGIAGASTTTLNINSLGAKTVYRFSTTKLTTQFPVGSIITLTYHADLNSGCWITNDYDSNTNTYQRVYESSNDVEYPITTRYNTTDGASYYAEYGRYTNGVTINPSTNTITASKFKGNVSGNEVVVNEYLIIPHDMDTGAGCNIFDESSSADKPVLAFLGNNGNEDVILRYIATPEKNYDAANKSYVDNKVAEIQQAILNGEW